MKETISYNTLLNRENFKKFGFLRTGGMCCFPGCCQCAVDAHHIMDRKLWSDGGYYLSNCAPVCEKHHLDCEHGVYTPYQVMKFANIDIQYLKKPDAFVWMTNEEYKEMFVNGVLDKFGNVV